MSDRIRTKGLVNEKYCVHLDNSNPELRGKHVIYQVGFVCSLKNWMRVPPLALFIVLPGAGSVGHQEGGSIGPAAEERRENKDKLQECRSFLGHFHDILEAIIFVRRAKKAKA